MAATRSADSAAAARQAATLNSTPTGSALYAWTMAGQKLTGAVIAWACGTNRGRGVLGPLQGRMMSPGRQSQSLKTSHSLESPQV